MQWIGFSVSTILCMVALGCTGTTRLPNTLMIPFLTPIASIDCGKNGSVQAASIENPLSSDTAIDFQIYLPPCYAANPDRLYPALYLMPGYGGTSNSWFRAGLATIADESILSGEVPPFLIVATSDTRDDLDAPFILQDILPYVESHYRASQLRQHRAVAGGSLGGGSAYRLVFKHPDLFASAGIFGNGAATGDEANIRSWLAAIPDAIRPRLFINYGEQDTYMLARARVLTALLDEAGIEHTDIFSPGNHSGTYWLTNFPAYFRWIAQDW
jgi:S-formylglutathione hydrolase FrmB